MKDPVDRAIRAVARRNSYALVWAQFGIAHLVTLVGLGLLRLYQPMSLGHFLTLIGVSQLLVAIDNVASIRLTRVMWRPVRAWEQAAGGQRTPALTIAAWRALVTLPREYVRRVRVSPFTISLELVVLVARSLSASIADLQAATERVMAGDLGARVPVVTIDETGRLAQSFNTMIEGLDEGERLRQVFGAYVDPRLAERVLAEGADLAGEELEVSVLFLDVRGFTAFAERARPREVVTLLNDLWELAVPVLLRHGGHANKFIGDGLLGVFGAPEPARLWAPAVDGEAPRAAESRAEPVAD
jgi:HAMP domain-containing protein